MSARYAAHNISPPVDTGDDKGSSKCSPNPFSVKTRWLIAVHTYRGSTPPRVMSSNRISRRRSTDPNAFCDRLIIHACIGRQ